MKHKKILLIEENYGDILAIQDSLKNLNGEHTLHVVHNIRDALQVLMGGSSPGRLENYTQTGKVRPDMVLLNINFLQDSAHEFLDVINKYYSLKNIRVFIIGDSAQTLDAELASKYGIAGYLVKPFNLQDTVNKSVVTFRQELARPGKAIMALPFFGLHDKFVGFLQYLKANMASVVAGQTIVTKATVSAVASVCVVGAIAVTPPKLSSSQAKKTARVTEVSQNRQDRTESPAINEHEALVAFESITLPKIEAFLPPVSTEPEVRKTAIKEVNKEQAPEENDDRAFRIVAIEEPEPVEEQVAAQ